MRNRLRLILRVFGIPQAVLILVGLILLVGCLFEDLQYALKIVRMYCALRKNAV